MSSAIMLVVFSVPPDQEAEFHHFYHRRFLPKLLEESPAIKNVRRYEEFGLGGSGRWYNKQFLTIYQMSDLPEAKDSDSIFANPAVADVLKEFNEWKERALGNFSRISFEQTWSHPRKPHNGPFCSRPFFLWQLEMKPEFDADFQKWYEDDYLPLQVAEIPTWDGALRYQSVGREQIRRLTFFESSDESTLTRCLTDLRS